MNFDVVVCILLLLGVASGFRKGLSRSGFGLLAVIAAFLAAAWVYPDNPKGFLVMFVVALIGAAVAGHTLGKVFKEAEDRWVDQVLGGAFGLANGVLFWVLVVVALMAFGPRGPREVVVHSRFAPFALEATHAVAEVVPAEMKARIEQSYFELGHTLTPGFSRPLPELPRGEI